MNDKLIINSISKIYFSITSFFIFIFLTLSIVFLLLSKGIYLKEVNLPSFHINKLYLKWDEKLNISIDKLTLFTHSNSSNSFQTKDIQKNLKNFGFFTSFLQSFIIERIDYRDISATLQYLDKNGGYIRASSSNFNIDTIIYKTNNYIHFKILSFKDSIKKVTAHGDIVLDLLKREIFANIDTDISSEISLNIYTYIDTMQLKYALTSQKEIKSISHLISILHLSKVMKYWVYDAIKMQSLLLQKAHGFIEFSKPNEAFSNLYVCADVKKMNYKYNKALDAIHTQTTNLEFKHGVLYIRPKDQTTYNFNLDRSWLKIDFSKKEFKLLLTLMLDGFVDKHLLHLLHTYNINLPFKQNSGSFKTNLVLDINLMTLDVDTQGIFNTDNANFTYLGLDLDLFDTSIKLHNSYVVIDKMYAKYKTNVSAQVTAKLDLKHNKGKINFDVDKANFNNGTLKLAKDKKMQVIYEINNGKDAIKASPSFWKIYSQEDMEIEALNIPFNYENLFASIPTTQINIKNIATLYTSGSISFKTLSTNLEVDLAQLNYQNIKLNQSNLLFDLSFADSSLVIKSKDTAQFTILGKDLFFKEPSISIYKDIIVAKSSEFRIENLLRTKLAFNYSTVFSNGYMNLKNIILSNSTFGDIFKKINTLGVRIEKQVDGFTAKCPEIGLSIDDTKKEWRVSLDSFSTLYRYSPILQKYSIDEGKVSIFREKKKNNISFLATVQHGYDLITINDKLISDYIISGDIDHKNNTLDLNINDKIKVHIGDKYSILGENIGVNINSVVNFLNNIKDQKNNSKTSDISLELTNSYLYFSPTRKAIADKINLQYYNNIVTAQLVHKNGEAGFKLQDDIFYLYGKNFNDAFMENIFSLSKFQNGSFDFSMRGSLDQYSGILYIKDTTIMEYKLLNNILAFINTIPSLVTFSLPGYSKNGLDVKNSYVNFDYKDSVFTFKDIYLNSKEMEIIGKGNASYTNNTIDLQLNLKTDLGSAVSKIPVVGYILLDKDSISTSLKVSGALDNPKVESMLATDIIVAPLNIIKRTLLFPFEIFK